MMPAQSTSYAGIMFADCSLDYFKEFRGKQGRGFNFRWEEIGNDPLTRQSLKRFTHSRKNVIARPVPGREATGPRVVLSVSEIIDRAGGAYRRLQHGRNHS